MVEMPSFQSSITESASTETSAPSLKDESSLFKLSVRAPIDSSPFGVSFCRSVKKGGVLIAGIRPDEWLLLGLREDVEALASASKLKGFVSKIDVTHSRFCLRLSGAQTTSVLEKVCSLDFSDEMFPNGATGSASVAKVAADLIRDDTGDEPSYLILADRSFGQYLYDAIQDSTTEFAT